VSKVESSLGGNTCKLGGVLLRRHGCLIIIIIIIINININIIIIIIIFFKLKKGNKKGQQKQK